ncbi:MAG: ABC transporter ATP-binding protein [Coriobacteriia bacterium]|nr:ABC transporter ATP-binding protein [Coriobacteriia bacterium]
MTNIAIRTEGLTRSFGPVRAVDALSIEVPEGSVFGFLGPNGSGKTTTIRLLLGLLAPDAGTLKVLGHDVRTDPGPIRAASGALMEHSGLYERLSAYENLDFYGRAWHIPRAERATRIRELLESIDLWDRRDQLVGTWSRGMKQKLAVLRTLLHRPRLVFLDEPTAGLDPIAAAALRDDLLRLVAEEGLTVFLTTHNLAEAERLCSLVGVVRRGSLIAFGHPDEIRVAAAGDHLEITGRGFDEALLAGLCDRDDVAGAEVINGRLCVELVPGGATPPIVAYVVSAGGEIEEVRRASESLEDAFLSLVGEVGPDAG